MCVILIKKVFNLTRLLIISLAPLFSYFPLYAANDLFVSQPAEEFSDFPFPWLIWQISSRNAPSPAAELKVIHFPIVSATPPPSEKEPGNQRHSHRALCTSLYYYFWAPLVVYPNAQMTEQSAPRDDAACVCSTPSAHASNKAERKTHWNAAGRRRNVCANEERENKWIHAERMGMSDGLFPCAGSRVSFLFDRRCDFCTM